MNIWSREASEGVFCPEELGIGIHNVWRGITNNTQLVD